MPAQFISNGGASVTNVPSVVLKHQPVTGSVINFAAVQWLNGGSAWSPAIAVWTSTNFFEPLGFAIDVSGGFADIYVAGILDGFPSFGAFAGYDVYVDPATPGGITFSPVPFTDTYVVMGKAISTTAIKIQPYNADDYVGVKGGLLTSAGLNNGTGDQVLNVGTDGNVLTARSASSLGLAWQPAVVASAPFTYTTATRTLTIATATDSVTGVMSAADHTNFTANTAARHNAVTIGTANGLSLATQVLSLAAATNSVPGALTAADHTTYSGYAATIALKAPLASPTFTGDVNSSTGNVLISTLGKGLQVKTGTNSKIGTATLVAGTVTVANTSVTANSRIFLTAQNNAGTIGSLSVTTITANTSFVIKSTNPLDTSLVAWMIVESIP